MDKGLPMAAKIHQFHREIYNLRELIICQLQIFIYPYPEADAKWWSLCAAVLTILFKSLEKDREFKLHKSQF